MAALEEHVQAHGAREAEAQPEGGHLGHVLGHEHHEAHERAHRGHEVGDAQRAHAQAPGCHAQEALHEPNILRVIVVGVSALGCAGVAATRDPRTPRFIAGRDATPCGEQAARRIGSCCCRCGGKGSSQRRIRIHWAGAIRRHHASDGVREGGYGTVLVSPWRRIGSTGERACPETSFFSLPGPDIGGSERRSRIAPEAVPAVQPHTHSAEGEAVHVHPVPHVDEVASQRHHGPVGEAQLPELYHLRGNGGRDPHCGQAHAPVTLAQNAAEGRALICGGLPAQALWLGQGDDEHGQTRVGKPGEEEAHPRVEHPEPQVQAPHIGHPLEVRQQMAEGVEHARGRVRKHGLQVWEEQQQRRGHGLAQSVPQAEEEDGEGRLGALAHVHVAPEAGQHLE
mmetsp:Transcript_13884/g.42005  ORF Transcript_13884/g.42005 Transcript_13884/m.42005 type:complete len:396 (+) Transcript_13884:1389-2576(+)